MNKKLLRFPVLTLIGGNILRLSDYIVLPTVLSNGATQWTSEMQTASFYILLITTIILFAVIGIILRRSYDKSTMIKSATLIVIYSIIVVVIEQMAILTGAYNIIILWLYLPFEIFISIAVLLSRTFNLESLNWIYIIPAIFSPYLFVLFVKKTNVSLENSK